MKDLTSNRLLIFGIIIIIFLLPLSYLYFQNKNSIFLTLLMFTPMISAIITRVITREGTKDLFLLPRFKGNVKWYLLSYLLTPFIAYTGALIFFIFKPNSLDLIHSEFAVKSGVSNVYDYYKLLLTMIPVAMFRSFLVL